MKTPPKIDIDQLKGILKITDLATQLGIELNRSNKALCVFHNEKTPSLSFNDEKGMFKCFSCNKSGDIIDLYEEVRQVNKGQAIKELAELVRLTPDARQTLKIDARRNFTHTSGQLHKKSATNENKGQYNKIYEELFCYCIGLDEESEKYLKSDKRGLTDETINRFLLASVKDYTKTNEHLKEKFSLEELKQAGIVNDNGNLLFYKHRLIIPFVDDGRIVFIQGRQLDNEGNKYLHLKGVSVPLYHKDILKQLKRGDRVYICEGVFDAMMLEQNGYHAVAILGVNNFKPEMTHQFKGLDVVLMFDNDEAGERATKEVAKELGIGVPKGKSMLAGCVAFEVRNDEGLHIAYYGIEMKNGKHKFYHTFNPELELLYFNRIDPDAPVQFCNDLFDCVRRWEIGNQAVSNFSLPYLSQSHIELLRKLKGGIEFLVPSERKKDFAIQAVELHTWYQFAA